MEIIEVVSTNVDSILRWFITDATMSSMILRANLFIDHLKVELNAYIGMDYFQLTCMYFIVS